MKTILVPLEDCDGADAMLETAWLLGRSFDSYIEGLFIKRALPGVVIADIGGYAAATPEVMESFAEEDRERGQRMRARFEDFARSKGLTTAAGGGAAPGAGDADAGLGRVGRAEGEDGHVGDGAVNRDAGAVDRLRCHGQLRAGPLGH